MPKVPGRPLAGRRFRLPRVSDSAITVESSRQASMCQPSLAWCETSPVFSSLSDGACVASRAENSLRRLLAEALLHGVTFRSNTFAGSVGFTKRHLLQRCLHATHMCGANARCDMNYDNCCGCTTCGEVTPCKLYYCALAGIKIEACTCYVHI